MENVNEVKLAKFEIMLKEASKWLYGYRGNYSKDGYVTMPFYFPLTDKIDYKSTDKMYILQKYTMFVLIK